MDDGLLCERIRWERLGAVLRLLPEDKAMIAMLRMRGDTEIEIARTMGMRRRTVTKYVLDAKQLVARAMPEAAMLLDGQGPGKAARREPDVAGGIESVGNDLGIPARPGWEDPAAKRWARTVGRKKRAGRKRRKAPGSGSGRASQKGVSKPKTMCYRIPSRWAARLEECLGERAAKLQGFLTRSEASVVVLWLEGLGKERIAEELELSEAAVNTRLVRARRRLRSVDPVLAEKLLSDWWRTWRRRSDRGR